jgi:integrase
MALDGNIKTDEKIKIPLSLRLNAVNWSVGEIVARCRDSVLSRHLLHHIRHKGKAKPGHPIMESTLTDAFAKARDLSGLTWPAIGEDEEPQDPPSLHEIRSLSERLYRNERGAKFAQSLLAHKHAKQTTEYDDPRSPRWVEIEI